MYFCLWVYVYELNVNYWQQWRFRNRLIWQSTDLSPCMFFSAEICLCVCVWVCVGTAIGPVVRSGVCQHHLSPVLVTQPKREDFCQTCHPLTCCSLTYQSVRGEEQFERRRHSYHRSFEQKVKQECVRGEKGGRGKRLIPLVFVAWNKKGAMFEETEDWLEIEKAVVCGGKEGGRRKKMGNKRSKEVNGEGERRENLGDWLWCGTDAAAVGQLGITWFKCSMRFCCVLFSVWLDNPHSAPSSAPPPLLLPLCCSRAQAFYNTLMRKSW